MSAVDTDTFKQRLEEERQRVVDAIDNIYAENFGMMLEEMEEPSFGKIGRAHV